MTVEPAVAGLVRVRTLGTIDLRCAHGPEAGARAVVSQPKRFALLAYLAAATPHGFHRRDTLLGLFWPELDLVQSRHALRQSLHFLRLRLGPVVVRRGDEDVGLDPAMLWCDAPAFEQALARNQPAAALELYAGDFLPGFFVSGVAPEFGQWLESERARLRACAARAAWAVADQAAGEGRGTDGAHWARRAVALAPDDEGGVRRLIAMLDRVGDRSGALRVYEAFAHGLRTEFEADPAPETRALVAAVRESGGEPRGAPDPLPVAAAPAAGSSGADPDFDQLVGRDHVLQLLRTEFRRALAGSCEPVLVLGEAGMGKTQLARHFARWVRAEGARCLVAHFFDYPGSRLAPYEILLDILASALRDENPGAADVSGPLVERVRARLGVTLPPELGHAAEGGAARPALPDPGQVSAAVGRCFRRLSHERPLVLVLDDLQWADEASRQVVGYLMRTAVADHLLIVGLARLEEAEERTHPLAAWLRQEAAARGFTSVRLRALTEKEVGTEVARVFTGVVIPAGAVATLHQLTGGNPYFLVETLRLLLENGLLTRDGGGSWRWHDPDGLLSGEIGGGAARTTAEKLVLPASLAAAADAKLDRLSPEVRALVETAAVIGEEFRLRTLAEAEGRDEAALEPLLAAAARAGVVTESGVAAGEDARFVHTLLRRACYAAVPARRRRRLHERVARSLEAVYRDGLDRVAVAIAGHWATAAQPGVALLWFLRASRAAVARGQWREAWEAIEGAHRVAEEAARVGAAVAPDVMAAFRLAEGEALLASGRLRESAAALAEAGRLARAGAPASAEFPLPPLEALALLRLARARANMGEYAEARAAAESAHQRYRALGDEAAAAAALVQAGEVDSALGEYARAVPLLEQALAVLDTPDGDGRLVAGAAAALGWTLALAGDAERALSHFERAHELYAAAGDQRQDAHVLRRTQWVHLSRGRYETAVRLATAARDAFQAVGDAFGEAKAELAIGQARVAQGLYEEGSTHLRRTLEATGALGDAHCEAEALWLLGHAEVESGRYPEGTVLLERALELVRGVGDRDDEFRMLIDLAAAHSAAADHAGALRLADEAALIARSLGSLDGEGAALVARAWALLGSGGPDAAVDAGRRAVALLEETRSGERWRGYWVLGAALAADDADAARDALRRAIALLAAVRDELPAGDTARRAGVTRARVEPARALVRVLRSLGRGAEAGDVARQWELHSA